MLTRACFRALGAFVLAQIGGRFALAIWLLAQGQALDALDQAIAATSLVAALYVGFVGGFRKLGEAVVDHLVAAESTVKNLAAKNRELTVERDRLLASLAKRSPYSQAAQVVAALMADEDPPEDPDVGDRR